MYCGSVNTKRRERHSSGLVWEIKSSHCVGTIQTFALERCNRNIYLTDLFYIILQRETGSLSPGCFCLSNLLGRTNTLSYYIRFQKCPLNVLQNVWSVTTTTTTTTMNTADASALISPWMTVWLSDCLSRFFEEWRFGENMYESINNLFDQYNNLMKYS